MLLCISMFMCVWLGVIFRIFIFNVWDVLLCGNMVCIVVLVKVCGFILVDGNDNVVLFMEFFFGCLQLLEQGCDVVVVFVIGGIELVQYIGDGVDVDGIGLGQWVVWIVDVFLYGQVGVLFVVYVLVDGVCCFVDEYVDGVYDYYVWYVFYW